MEKILALTQHGLGVDLDLEFERKVAGPYSSEIYKLESLAGKQRWFAAKERSGGGATYRTLENIQERTSAAADILGDQMSRFDWLISQFAKMNTEQAELLATTYMVWNDLILDGTPSPSPDQIAAGVHAWHPEKAKFNRTRISDCIKWMKDNDLIPSGMGSHTTDVNS